MQENIIAICGVIPEGFKKVVIEGSDYTFKNDPTFNAISLYNFFGKAATVNSFQECFYYVELGFSQGMFNIFDLILRVTIIFLSIFVFYKIYKSKKIKIYSLKKIISKTKNLFSKNKFKKEFLLFSFISAALLQNFYIFDYVRTKAARIPNFIDEYISLTSNVSFFSNLDFNAGDFIGGSYSIYLTSGPVSAIGGVLGWNLTKSLTIARLGNFYWLLLLQLIFAIVLCKSKKSNLFFIIPMSCILITLIPWWQGGLYSLGEISSMLIFTNSVFLFNKYRRLSLVLISISIFYGKLLTLLPFIGFYIFVAFNEKDLKKIIYDFISVVAPYGVYLILAWYNIENFQLLIFLENQINLFLNHQSSGLSKFWEISLTENFEMSEASRWQSIDIYRILIFPILVILLIYKNKIALNKYFYNISYPLIGSIVLPYLWFWILSPTKWIRYSQHFTITSIIVILYLLNFELVNNKIDIFLTFMMIFALGSEYSPTYLFIVAILLLFSSLFVKKTNIKINKVFVIISLSLMIALPYYEKDTFGNLNYSFIECFENLLNDQCKNAYMGE